ncbi:hypothetical protein FACS1894216_15360 [Synergistales bacterium]|nr:hypothetical protein FACS1894216_15360 [Synergistales bacterium]
MSKSNITIASNVYNRVNDNILRDPNFVAKITDAAALKKLVPQLSDKLSPPDVKFSPWQSEALIESLSCWGNKGRNDTTHGLARVNDKYVWSCRCENSACQEGKDCNYEYCMSDANAMRIVREPNVVEDKAVNDAPHLSFEYEYLGDISQIFEPPAEEEIETAAEEEPEPQEYLTQPVVSDEKGYTKIAEPTQIITAAIGSHILVNAGPGTGKTYTIIRRLEHIAKTQAVNDFGAVLVLCYTNAAKNEIRKRLEAGISDGSLPPETRQFDVRTFDSLATAYLADIDDDGFASLDYNGRIKRFNDAFDPEMFEAFEYVIIDELQDLVNERAKMTLNILGALTGGWLLCGDKCQAIYDYDCAGDDNISSVEFYKSIENKLPSDAQRYELVCNRRQCDALAVCSNDLRDALLLFSIGDANTFFLDTIKDYQPVKFQADLFSNVGSGDSTVAILCRNNGEAEWVSAELHAHNISHTLLRSVTPHVSLRRWIADIFWDYREPRINSSAFAERYCARVSDDEVEAEAVFSALIGTIASISDSDVSKETIDMELLKKALRRGVELDACFLNANYEKLTVSTIHKAKGREFDRVYLLNEFNPKPGNTEEARVWYVGATRPKHELHRIKGLKQYFKKVPPLGRWMMTLVKRTRYSREYMKYCSRLNIGYPSDVDSNMFIRGDLHQALDVQQYLAEQVNVGNKVELHRTGEGAYFVMHNGHYIGQLSKTVEADFRTAINMTDNRANLPSFLSEIYVSNIVTIVAASFPGGADRMFKDSSFWLGVELTGFAKVDWRRGKE